VTKKEHKLVTRWSQQPATVQWTETILDQIVAHRPGAFPTRTARGLGLLHIGMLDALTAAQDVSREFTRKPPFRLDDEIERLAPASRRSYPDLVATIAGAAEVILTYLFSPQEPSATFAQLASQAGRSRLIAGVATRSDVRQGRALGNQVGQAVVTYAQTDGTQNSPAPIFAERATDHCTTTCGETPPVDEGQDETYWVPTPIHYQWPTTDPAASTWKTYLLESPSQYRPPLPYAYGSPEYCSELAEVKQLNDTATGADRQIAFFWDDGPGTLSPAGHWNDIALDLVDGRGLKTVATTRLFALMNAAIVDGFIATWDAKYEYWTQRPVTGIRERSSICGGASYDPTWLPNILTPPFPSFPSGHSAESAAAARVLQWFFPDRKGASDGLADQTTAQGSIDEIADEVALSRLIGGIHFRADNDAGLRLGRRIGGLAIAYARAQGWTAPRA
jgi:membrane-associated phospholipid phosphatase